MARADDYAASLDPRVIGQVTDAIFHYVSVIGSEGTGVTGHQARVAFANKILLNQVNLQPLILSTVSFASLNAASTDTTVDNAVAAQFNLWAGNV